LENGLPPPFWLFKTFLSATEGAWPAFFAPGGMAKGVQNRLLQLSENQPVFSGVSKV
jgi:hypothetical protein